MVLLRGTRLDSCEIFELIGSRGLRLPHNHRGPELGLAERRPLIRLRAGFDFGVVFQNGIRFRPQFTGGSNAGSFRETVFRSTFRNSNVRGCNCVYGCAVQLFRSTGK